MCGVGHLSLLFLFDTFFRFSHTKVDTLSADFAYVFLVAPQMTTLSCGRRAKTYLTSFYNPTPHRVRYQETG